LLFFVYQLFIAFYYLLFLFHYILLRSWAGRRSGGSESESDDENVQQVSSDFGPPAFAHPSQFSNNLAARKFANQAANSPQLSWAEFLQDE
jgi:hypothetical protein